MSKGKKYENCGKCEDIFTIVPGAGIGKCRRLNREVLTDRIALDCPLPDWPRVSREEIYHACHGMTAVVRDIRAALRRKDKERKP